MTIRPGIVILREQRDRRISLHDPTRIINLRESTWLDDRRAPAARPANQLLIATPQIRNAPKPFKISAGTRSNRNKSGGLKLG